MVRRVRPLLSMLAALALLAPAAAHAAPASAPQPPAVQTQLLRSLTLYKDADLEFGSVVAVGAGTAVIDPVSGNLTTTGGLVGLSGSSHPARFSGAASGSSVVIIRIPNQPVTLTRVGGTETVRVSSFTLDSPSKKEMAQSTTFEFRVGGTLTVPAGQVEGLYTGTFEVTVQYP